MIQNGSTKLKKHSRRKELRFKEKEPVFNFVLERVTVPRLYEEFCDNCKGTGIDPENRIRICRTKYKKLFYSKPLKATIATCPKCKGKGKMTWTEKIRGIKDE